MIRVALLCLALLVLPWALEPPSFAATVTVPGNLNITPLDISIVTTGGVAVQALGPGKRTAGGWLFNPVEATINLCINENGTASGTISQGNTTCIPPGTPYKLTPSAQPVSVVSSDSSHAFSGYGLNK